MAFQAKAEIRKAQEEQKLRDEEKEQRKRDALKKRITTQLRQNTEQSLKNESVSGGAGRNMVSVRDSQPIAESQNEDIDKLLDNQNVDSLNPDSAIDGRQTGSALDGGPLDSDAGLQ